MSATFDATTTAEYNAATTAAARSAVIVAALTGTVSVIVYDGDDTEMGSGTMAAPWATASESTVTVGEVSSFTVGTTATPDADWYIRFENSDASRWVRGSFGLSSSSQDFTWSLATWTDTQTGTIGTATITTTGNSAPVFTVAPTTATLGSSGGTIQFTATDADSDTIIYSLTTTRNGITINSSTGLVTVTSAAAGTSGNIVVTASDGILTDTATCFVTVSAASQTADFTIPASSSARTLNGQSNTAYGTTSWASLSPTGKTRPAAGDVIEFANGTHATITLSGIRGSAAGGRITIRPAAGALVTMNSTSTFRWNINNCQYLTIDGATTNSSASVPILHAPAPYRCGFKMTGTGNCTAWIKFGITTHLPKQITIQYVEIAGSNTTGSCVHYQDDTGNRIATFPNQYREDFALRYCYFHNAGGLYHGGNYEAQETGGLETPCRRSTIEYNRIVNSTEENIGLKMHWEGPNYIRYNWLEGAGRDTTGAAIDQRNAISIQCSTCYVYGNFIVNAGQGDTAQGVGLGPNGISLLASNGPDITGVPSAGSGVPDSSFDEYGPFPYNLVEIYNNIIVDAAWNGINSRLGTLSSSKGPGVVNLVPQLLKVYNNTIVSNGASGTGYDGINVADSSAVYAGSFIRNNIIVESAGSELAGYASTLGGSNNRTTGTAASLFVVTTGSDYTARDYHLTGAVAVASGSTLGTNVATTDLDGDTRTLANADMGAYEYP